VSDLSKVEARKKIKKRTQGKKAVFLGNIGVRLNYGKDAMIGNCSPEKKKGF